MGVDRYSKWCEPIAAFLDAHPPTFEHKETFVVLCHDKPWHTIPFSLKEAEAATRAARTAKVDKVPDEWKIHGNGQGGASAVVWVERHG